WVKRKAGTLPAEIDAMSYVEESSCDPGNCLAKWFCLQDTIILELHAGVSVLHHQGAGCRCVIPCKNFELAAESGALQNIEKRLNRGKDRGLFSEDEVVALAVQWNEVQTECLGGRTRRKAHVRVARYHAVRRGQ